MLRSTCDCYPVPGVRECYVPLGTLYTAEVVSVAGRWILSVIRSVAVEVGGWIRSCRGGRVVKCAFVHGDES